MTRRAALALAALIATPACGAGFDVVLPAPPPSGWAVALEAAPGRLSLEWAPLAGVTEYVVHLEADAQPIVAEPVTCAAISECRWTSARLDTSGTLTYDAFVTGGGETSISLSAKPLPAGWASLIPWRTPWTYPSAGLVNFGYRSYPLGRVNGDDFDDFIVLSPDDSSSRGAALVFFGGSDGPEAPVVLVGDVAGDRFGVSAVSVGTLGDEYADFVVSRSHPAGDTVGRVNLYRGNATGFTLDTSFTAVGTIAGEYGSALAFGELDAAPGGDLAIAEPAFDGTLTNEGRVVIRPSVLADDNLLYSAPFSAANARTATQLIGLGNVMTTAGDEIGMTGCSANCGTAAATYYALVTDLDSEKFYVDATDIDSAGDVNDDGWNDVITGSDVTNRADLWLGDPDGDLVHALYLNSSFEMSHALGGRLCGVGDVNGDGFDDVLFSDLAWPAGPDTYGRAYLFMGGTAGLSTSASLVFEGATATSNLGRCGAVGDVDADGAGDFIVTDRTQLMLQYGPRAGGPFVSFAMVTTSAAGSAISFAGSEVTARPATTLSCEWDFGDESGSSACTAPPHVYAPGVYDVRLTVTDDFGFTAAGGIRLTVP